MNWINIIRSIMGHGMRQSEIARHVGCDKSYISYLLSGKKSSPSHALGQALIQLERNTRRRKPGSKK